MTIEQSIKKEGKKEGLKEGEYRKTIEMAKKMKKEGFTVNSIIRITELTKEQIEKL